MGAAKDAIVLLTARLGCLSVGLALQRAVLGPRFIRVVNYHATPGTQATALDAQLAFLTRYFAPARPEDLDACLAGRPSLERPALLLTFDDGFRSNYDVAAPIIERHGFRGFFFVPEAHIAENRAAADADFATACPDEPEPRMTWAECRDLANRGHRIGCHSRTHVRLSDQLSGDEVRDEVTQAGIDIARRLGLPVEDFCWVGGEEWSYGRRAFEEIHRAGYRRAFMTNLFPVTRATPPDWIQRTNLEADWSLDQVRFYLSGIMDVAYGPKRRRLARKLRAGGGHVPAEGPGSFPA